jgi:two-component system OmpR family sensor kinase
LRNPERKALLRFVSLFIALNTIFLLIISVIYYSYQKNIFTEIRHDSMVYYTGTQKEHIFNAKNITELHRYLSRDPRFKIALLTKDKKIAFASIPHLKFPIKEGFFEDDHYFYYIDIIEVEHLKQIHYIVVRANTIDKQLEQTRKSIYMFLIFSILFLSAVIYALSKLFLQPLRDAIAKLDQFIRDTTHELNTPLSVITMSIEQLDKSSLETRYLKHINRIDVASRTISNLYNDLAFLMVHEQGKKNDSDIELEILFEERIEYFRPLAQAKKITMHTNLAASFILADREKMIRIIDNLLSNAIKYNKPMGDIYITLTKNSLIIQDTGIGIERDKLEQIFNRYMRFDNANGGFGIGLNIIQIICQEYSFKITVDSELSMGTTFTITWS